MRFRRYLRHCASREIILTRRKFALCCRSHHVVRIEKGELYYSGKRAGYLPGRTGIWYLTTDRFTDSRDLTDHLAILQGWLRPAPNDNQRLMHLRDIMGRMGAKASFSVFWYGRANDAPPEIPGEFARLTSELGADIETDYHTDADETEAEPLIPKL